MNFAYAPRALAGLRQDCDKTFHRGAGYRSEYDEFHFEDLVRGFDGGILQQSHTMFLLGVGGGCQRRFAIE
jgi:hypothetical protein